MSTNAANSSRPLNDAHVAEVQRAVSQTLRNVLSPLEVRIEKAFLAHRSRPLLRPFCNIFERNLRICLDQHSYIWGDELRINTRLVQIIDASPVSEEDKNQAIFWLILFHTSYFAAGYQSRLAKLAKDQRPLHHLAFTQAVLHQMASLQVQQPSDAAYWKDNGYGFRPLMGIQPSATTEVDVLEALTAGRIQPETLTATAMPDFVSLKGQGGQLADYQAQNHEAFAQELINDWVMEFTKSFDFGSQSLNGIRLLYFKAHPPRDVSEAIMDCLRSKYPVADDLALYNNRKLAYEYFAPRKADPIEDKTGHIELFCDCSGSISAEDIGNCLKVFNDFFAKRKKKMTYAINCFDTSILSRIEVTEEEDPVEKLKQLALVGGGGTDFRCTAAKIDDLQNADSRYHCDLAVVFTDLAGVFPDTTPCDFVWVTTTKQCNLGAVTSVAVPGTVIYC